MKHILAFILMTFVSLAFTQESQTEEKEIEWRRRCECSVTDMDRGHYYGSSNRSAEDATERVFRDCYSRTQSPGTCEVANYDFCGCRY